MTARPPRRLRPSIEKRQDTSVATHTALSGQGSVSSARPVAEGDRKAVPYVVPASIQTGDTGTETTATAISSTSGTGDGRSTALGPFAVALGYLSRAVTRAIAIGSNTDATGDSSIGIGYDTTAASQYSIAIGFSLGAFADHAIGIGTNVKAWGAQCVAIGRRAFAIADSAVAIGYQAQANGDRAVAIGANVTAANADDFVLGTSSHNVSIPGDVGFHGAAPVGQSATPVTLADAIAVLQAHGLCA